ncbi:MAG: hypothetical protein KatS3mg002_1024 [Candidatus Woesearchaeota archaeon]|nr:MAG: hypothetical protein KatS3mg002_1024 [Candidatus Woesearchaeota archaeon]
MDKKDYCYDVEVFKNFLCFTFVNIEDENEIYTFSISWQYGIDQKDELIDFIENKVNHLIGYNNLFYDREILYEVITYNKSKDINLHIYNFSQNIISNNRNVLFSPNRKLAWKDIDLMRIPAFDKLGISLKAVSVSLKWHKIQDLPLPYDKPIKKEEIETIIQYNINDVLITRELYKKLYPQIELRIKLSELFNVDLLNASDSKIGNVILEDYYKKQEPDFNIHKKTNKDVKFFWLSECISDKVKFKTEKLNNLLLKLRETILVKENKYKYKEKITFAGITYELGIGGLHSEDNPAKFVSSENYKIIDADVTSYYPNIILNEKVYPSHLSETFLDILRKMTEERVKAKKEKDKLKADALKISINSIFGKMGSELFYLYDPKGLIKVTVNGQLFLLMLIEELHLNDIPVISANTDGIVSYVNKDKIDDYYRICKEWESKTNLSLEFTEYKLYVRTDVNNYITLKVDGEVKEKGRFMTDIEINKAYSFPVVSDALFFYYMKDIPVIDTIKKERDILNFCFSQKAGDKFDFVYRTEEGNDIPLQKTNRCYISNAGGKLVKINRENGNEIGVYVSNYVRILNDYDKNIPFEEYDVNYDFYVEEAEKYIREIKEIEDEIAIQKEKLLEEKNEDEDNEYSTIPENSKNLKIKNIEFGKSKYFYSYDKNESVIYMGLAGIKFITPQVAKELYKLYTKKYNSFLDLLIDLSELKITNKQLEILIYLDFFKTFGKNGKLHKVFKEFTEGKFKYSKNHKEETRIKRYKELLNFEKYTKDTRIPILQNIIFQKENLGMVYTLFEELDKRIANCRKC